MLSRSDNTTTQSLLGGRSYCSTAPSNEECTAFTFTPASGTCELYRHTGFRPNPDTQSYQVKEPVNPTTAGTEATPTTTTPTTTTLEPWDCPLEGVFFLPDTDDCRKYHMCVNGAHLSMSCPRGLLFDFASGLCKVADEAHCYPGATTPQPNPCLEGGAIIQPHPDDCGKYFICANPENPTVLPCAEGLFFDYVRGTCVPESEVECFPGATMPPTPTTTTETPIHGICPDTGNSVEPHPYDCTKYFICIDGTPFLQHCSAQQLFDILSLTCLPELEALCFETATTTTKKPENPCPSSGVMLLPHPYDCSRYFFCSNGTETQLACPDGMLFDTASEQCNIAEDATCADGATTRPTPTTTMVTSSNTETTQPTRATSDNPDATETDETSVPTTGSPTSSSTSASSFQTEGTSPSEEVSTTSERFQWPSSASRCAENILIALMMLGLVTFY